MEKIIKFETINQYNTMMKQKTLHPLVSVIDFSKVPAMDFGKTHIFGFYTVFLKEIKCGNIKYGRNYYDYQDGTLVFVAPSQVVSIENQSKHRAKGWGLLFHPDLIHGTSLGRNMRHYSFFSYETNEALHLSEEERKIIIECLHNIQIELYHAIDQHSKTLIISSIELLLNYCVRFYDRQFLTRSHKNTDILMRFETLLDEYFISDLPQTKGLPSVKYCAEKLYLSSNYLGDLLKKETGKNAQEHIQLKIIDLAKEKIFDTRKTISEIAYELGFDYPQYFNRMFKKRVGCTPNEYRETV